MTILNINNPFNAPVYHEETVESTMEISRTLAEKGEPHGTVIVCDFQRNGRGRIKGRSWQMERELNLPFTVMLRFSKIEEIPAALSLRAGLAAAAAIEDFTPALENRVMIKWPNDIIIDNKKIAGVLCEANGSIVHIGIGVNVAQKTFPSSLEGKAGSITLAAGIEIDKNGRFSLLEKILARLYMEFEARLEKENDKTPSWKLRVDKRLYKKDESVSFIEGAADSGNQITGVLYGIGENGELLIVPNGETEPRACVTGELDW